MVSWTDLRRGVKFHNFIGGGLLGDGAEWKVPFLGPRLSRSKQRQNNKRTTLNIASGQIVVEKYKHYY